MSDQSLLQFLLMPLSLVLAAMPMPIAAQADEAPRISDPVVHDNLAIYFLKGKSADGPVPLILDEALAKGFVKVHETKTVSELQIENVGDQDVLVHAGDIVKGGQQDRVLTVTILVPPKSGRVPIASFCVERGRWSARGSEDVRTFASSKDFLPSLDAKKAMRSAQKAEVARVAAAEARSREVPSYTEPHRNQQQAAQIPEPPGVMREGLAAGAESSNPEMHRRAMAEMQRRYPRGLNSLLGSLPLHGDDAQGEVWRSVDSMQMSLAAGLNASVTSSLSESSLQLALENEKLQNERRVFVETLLPRGELEPDVVGLVIAVNGRIASADIYPSNALFRKLWPKHVNAAATEAISQRSKSGDTAANPSVADVQAFLDDADKTEPQEQKLSDTLRLEVSEGEKVEVFATRMLGGALLHRNLLRR